MKFSCEHCRTSYSIANDKVRGKILTIRCRRCQSVIVVRDPDTPTDESQPSGALAASRGAKVSASAQPPPPPQGRAPTPLPDNLTLDFDAGEDELDRALDKIGEDISPPAPPPPVAKRPVQEDTVVAEVPGARMRELDAASEMTPAPCAPPPMAPEWFLGIGGEQQGPMTLVALRARFESGDAKGDALVWKGGMADWVLALNVDDVKDVVKVIAPPPVPAVVAVAAPSEALPARSPLRIAKPVDPAFSDFGDIGGTLMLDAGAILSIEEIPRRRQPSKARVVVTAALGIIGVSGAIVGLMVAVGAIDLFGTETASREKGRRNELLHVEGTGPLVFRETKIIEVSKNGRRRGGGAREPASAGPLAGTPVPSARAGADMNTSMRMGNSVGPGTAEPSAEMRRMIASTAGLVESGPIEQPVVRARREKDDPTADDAQRFKKLFSSHYKRSVTGCYNKALKTDSSIQGSIILTMELNERSKIKSLGMSRFQGSPFESCVKESSRTWKFAGVSPGTTIEYTLTLARTE
ncbi:MAG: zinc-ribbon domain-containing protein [Deltaproteobacteria bacterium]|nr:zinc-ribbon domain-containing protein [Deltaproteobacteria bacterium]